jgi:hypothetical protein
VRPENGRRAGGKTDGNPAARGKSCKSRRGRDDCNDKCYLAYVEAGIAMGRRPELVGLGLIRSLGGWRELKKIRLKGMERVKSDERILGDSNFVLSVLAQKPVNMMSRN